ncbi:MULTISPECIES: hypothetical protein [unclassified Bradyrhizobium]|uniref:hypothetical protein n=1 Tax=unclassified Bradyrhizobium TaxID=2631580 RepID=UPI0020133256|nr:MULTISPECIES: hypothetical protein [unclassified Bradyrhizobium]
MRKHRKPEVRRPSVSSRREGAHFIGIMHIIIMPPQFIIIGMPVPIMLIMFWQHCMNMSFMAGSIGAMSQVMPLAVIVQVTLHIIIGIAMAVMPGMPPIIGIMPFIIGDMPPIIGIMVCIAGFIGISMRGDEITPSVVVRGMVF